MVGAAGRAEQVVTGYLRALDRAEKALDADLEKYLPLWKLAVPPEFENVHPWDFSRFGRGERFVYPAIPRTEFDEVLAQASAGGSINISRTRASNIWRRI
jgi:hypothetical protein